MLKYMISPSTPPPPTDLAKDVTTNLRENARPGPAHHRQGAPGTAWSNYSFGAAGPHRGADHSGCCTVCPRPRPEPDRRMAGRGAEYRQAGTAGSGSSAASAGICRASAGLKPDPARSLGIAGYASVGVAASHRFRY